jgi:hypothetical protein
LESHWGREQADQLLHVDTSQFWGAAQSLPSHAPSPHTVFIMSSETLQNTVLLPNASVTLSGYEGSGI